MERTFAFETHLKLSELAKLDTNETKFISPTELVCNLYLLMREDLHSMYDELSNQATTSEKTAGDHFHCFREIRRKIARFTILEVFLTKIFHHWVYHSGRIQSLLNLEMQSIVLYSNNLLLSNYSNEKVNIISSGIVRKTATDSVTLKQQISYN